MSDVNTLHQLVAGALKIAPAQVTAETSMDDTLAWDSLAHMDLIVTLEEHYGVQLEPDDMVAMRSVGAIAGVLRARGVLA